MKPSSSLEESLGWPVKTLWGNISTNMAQYWAHLLRRTGSPRILEALDSSGSPTHLLLIKPFRTPMLFWEKRWVSLYFVLILLFREELGHFNFSILFGFWERWLSSLLTLKNHTAHTVLTYDYKSKFLFWEVVSFEFGCYLGKRWKF